MIEKYLKNKSILVTGGTGSFGQAFVKKILQMKVKIKKLVIFSRDELKQFEMDKKFSEKKYSQIRYFLGDVRDKDRLKRAMNEIDIVIHAAALKHVPKGEYDPIEFIKTNVYGAQNIIETALDSKVQKVIALSTDKAAAPINLYGASKLCSDKLFTAANNIKGKKNILFSIVRYGNVFGSRGSIVPFFLDQIKKGLPMTITDEKMTRFNISLEDGVKMVLWSIVNSKGGEIFVPKLPSFRVVDLVKALSKNIKTKIIGIRPGEKIHEDMITVADSQNTIDIGKYYAILSDPTVVKNKYPKAKKVKINFSYNSGNNKDFLSIPQLKKEIIKFKK
ncbi:UDP-N-acetylglucosamine 4,6-dehydratase (inverting) [Candidatus Pelagibacter ubique]|nr:UDP-N-acetylglucosamine 4,6-dehydratase (inverting) [Candidatus Pelagibacter ubique]